MRESKYRNRTSKTEYKSLKIRDKTLIQKVDSVCRKENITWERIVSIALREYLKNHVNDDLSDKTSEELKEIIRQYRLEGV